MAVRKIGRGVRIEPDRVLQHGGADPFGCHLAKLEAEACPDTTAQRVEAPVAEMIHQRQVVGGIGVPAMIGGDGARERPALRWSIAMTR